MARGPEAQRLVAAQPQPKGGRGLPNPGTSDRQLQQIAFDSSSSLGSAGRPVHHHSSRGYGTLGLVGIGIGSTFAKRAHSTSRSSTGSNRAAAERLTNWDASFHLISFMAGSGLLCLPLALVQMSWFGVLLLIAAGLVSSYTSTLLIEALHIVRWSSGSAVEYSALGYECFGRIGQYGTALLVHACFLITSTGYLSLSTSCLMGITGLSSSTALLLIACCVWSQVLVSSLKKLVMISIVNLAVAYWIELVIFGDATYPLTQIAMEDPTFEFTTPDLTGQPLYAKLAYSFSLLASGFFCHSIVPTIYNAMEDHRQCSKVVVRSQLGVLASLYLPICVVTFAVYGTTLQAPVFFNMRNVFVRDVTIVLYCIHLLLSYTVTIFPLQRALEKWLLEMPCNALPGIQSHLEESSHVEVTVRIACRTLVVLLTVFFSYVLAPTTLSVFGYMIIPSNTMSLILPSIFYWKLCRADASIWGRIANVGIMVLAFATMACSLRVVI